MLTCPRFLFGLALPVGTVGTFEGVASPVATGSSDDSYSSVGTSYISTCTSLAAGGGVSTCTVTKEGSLSGSITGYLLFTGLVVNSLAFKISLFARILIEDGPVERGLVLR